MNTGDVLGLLTLVFALPLSWVVSALTWRLSLARPTNKVLRDRAIVALAVSIIVTVFALIFLNNDLDIPPLSTDITRIVTRSVVLVCSVSASAYWLWVFYKT